MTILRQCPEHGATMAIRNGRLQCVRVLRSKKLDAQWQCSETAPLPPDLAMAAAGAERLL